MNSIDKCLKLLPERYHEEFLNDVIVDYESIRSLRKVFSYYLADIYNELSTDEQERIEEKMLVITL